MADLIKKGQEFDAAKRKSYRSSLVSIKRGAFTTANVPAQIGLTSAAVEDSSGIVFEQRVRTYTIHVTDYKVNSVVVEPAPGDVIIDSVDGTARHYEVLPQAGQPEKQWADAFGLAWMISTKLING